MPVKYKTGIVLSGGGARGFSHLGVLQALNEAGIFPDIISSVSSGAIAGVFYADGYKPQQILKILNGNNRLDYLGFVLPKEGLMEMTGLTKILTKYLCARKFEDLKLPMYVAATDLNNGQIKYFSEGELINRIVASSSIPVLFKPVTIDDIDYLDGGIMDNLPVQPLSKNCKYLIGSHVNPIGNVGKLTNLISIAERTFYLSVASDVIDKAKQFNLFIDPYALKDFGILDPGKGNEIYEIGYKETKKKLRQFLKKNKEF